MHRKGRQEIAGIREREVPARHIQALEQGLEPDYVGMQVLQAIKDGDFFIFTHPEAKPWVQEWHDRIMAGIDRAAAVRELLGIPTPKRLLKPRSRRPGSRRLTNDSPAPPTLPDGRFRTPSWGVEQRTGGEPS